MSDCIIKVILNVGTVTDKHNESRFQLKKLRKVFFFVYVRTYDAIPF